MGCSVKLLSGCPDKKFEDALLHFRQLNISQVSWNETLTKILSETTNTTRTFLENPVHTGTILEFGWCWWSSSFQCLHICEHGHLFSIYMSNKKYCNQSLVWWLARLTRPRLLLGSPLPLPLQLTLSSTIYDKLVGLAKFQPDGLDKQLICSQFQNQFHKVQSKLSHLKDSHKCSAQHFVCNEIAVFVRRLIRFVQH